ncbi:ABC transporter permease [Candidatus Acetothermia bacterium]|nr:ABC transporter permease [Candidatus Acetothermia bacterium]
MQVTTKTLPPSLWRVRMHLWLKGMGQSWSTFRESPIGVTGLVIIVFFGLLGAFYPIYPWFMGKIAWDQETIQKEGIDLNIVYNPIFGVGNDPLLIKGFPQPPSLRHPLGTNADGPDVLAQIMYSASREFLLGMMAALITVIIGTFIGAVAAYYGGWIDTLFMRLADVFVLFPPIAFLVVVSALVQRAGIEMTHMLLALILGLLFGFGSITIVLKSQALTIKVKPYIEAARVAGGSSFHIIFAHIIPNILPLSFLYMMFNVTTAIFSEAALSFFGLLPSINMSWGLMLFRAHTQGWILGHQGAFYWWVWMPPGLAVTLLCSAFYLVGRGLDEIVNPRLRKR